MKYYKLPENILIAILEYLKTKPYIEVAEGFQALNTLELLTEVKKDPGPPNEPAKTV